MPSTDAVLEHHLSTFGEQDLAGVMEDYTEESVVVTNMGTFEGLDEIEGLFEDLFAEFSQEGATIDMQQETVEDEFAYIVWQAETPENVYEFATDTFYIPDDEILFQSFAGKRSPKD
ncbi:nuclear transport factor 2 family protein [Natrinema longum]|uniref:Nuclear transport factor 2 family protein n=1 Tax=Natrinema longum TaxID=370324 RepID=A0A8A2UAS6_9EURY|nr:nuclear transport factor 2 family protein [Natrinema longum]MBZ6496387.1 nuclear transport factor 2 family protein [Natrinema longum]QSW85703.1 nuclear transport factor 2 family protein [Natrinema longum]